MSDNTQKLFSPQKLGALELKNRVVMAPMTRSRANPEGVPSELAITYYSERAGAGLIITEGTQPSYQGQGYCRTPGIHTDDQVAAWRKITDAVHDAGGLIALQIMHVGRIAHPLNQIGDPGIVAPSAIAAAGEMYTDQEGPQPHPVPHALETDEVAGVIDEFRLATRRALEAGFDAVELHSANGYLPMQFLSSGSNQRTDRYGGSAENRVRFTVEALDAMIEEAGPGRVGVRISPGGTYNDISDDDVLETYTTLLNAIADKPLAYIHAQRTGFDLDQLHPLMNVPFIATGDYDRDSGEQALQNGQAEAIGFARPMLANPDLVERFRNGWPLNEIDFSTFFTPGAKGYTDYPAFESEAAE